jgi:hypothetical protein
MKTFLDKDGKDVQVEIFPLLYPVKTTKIAHVTDEI